MFLKFISLSRAEISIKGNCSFIYHFNQYSSSVLYSFIVAISISFLYNHFLLSGNS